MCTTYFIYCNVLYCGQDVCKFLATVVSYAGADGGQGDEDAAEDVDEGPSMV